jgi:hypothetical protein
MGPKKSLKGEWAAWIAPVGERAQHKRLLFRREEKK